MVKSSFRYMFKNKNITVMGLGLLGRGVGDIDYLARKGANLTVTDLKDKIALKGSIDKLKIHKNIKFVLGEHRFEDFENKDFVIKGAGVPLDSPFISHAIKNKVKVTMSTALFAKFTKGILIGVTGTKGKSTVTHLIYEILKNAKKRVFLGGNVKGVSTITLLNEVKEGDLVVLELDSWQLQGFGYENISPHIAVFTNFMEDHLNYYKGDMDKYFDDKSNIYKFQNKEDYLITNLKVTTKSKIIKPSILEYGSKLLGEHNMENISFAIEVANLLNINNDIIQKTISNFGSLSGRLENIANKKGVLYFNDTNSTTPQSTIKALNLFEKDKLILIAGGGDKCLDFQNIAEILNKGIKKIILLNGVGTDRIKSLLNIDYIEVSSMREAVKEAEKNAVSGDIVLMSPAASSFGLFVNEYDRGSQFIEEVKKI